MSGLCEPIPHRIMAVDPYAAHVAAGARFIVNSATTLFTLEPEDAKAYLINSASQIVLGCPPTLPWAAPFRGDVHRGLFAGPTSIAYFFWSLSTRHPDLEIEGRRPLDWCRAYLDLAESEEAPRLLEVSCGITNEFLASNAIKACVYRNEDFANELLEGSYFLSAFPLGLVYFGNSETFSSLIHHFLSSSRLFRSIFSAPFALYAY